MAPEARRLGIGRMLLEAVISWAKTRDVDYLELDVTQSEIPAVQLYLHAGFKPTGKVDSLRPGSNLISQEMRLIFKKS